MSDYYSVDPMFGSLKDFDLLVEKVHARGQACSTSSVGSTRCSRPGSADSAGQPRGVDNLVGQGICGDGVPLADFVVPGPRRTA